ncbi:MAG: metallophosphoesterase [Pararhodobacter sp.]|nr:metallophosphoesterase [Pararhodobacter sp.]
MRSYAIGDIHGHLDLLLAAQALVEADRAQAGDSDAPLVHIGDLVDRGRDSRAVIEHLMAGQREGRPWVVLKGNHDRMFVQFLDEPSRNDPGLRPIFTWLHPRIGGATTLEAYGVASPAERPVRAVHEDALARVPAAHRDWLNELPAHFLHAQALFVHAGIRPGVKLENQTETDLIWIRHDFLDHGAPHPWLVVHGHTAIEAPRHYGNRVNIDSSAAYGGPVSAVVIERGAVWQLTPSGRRALTPP